MRKTIKRLGAVLLAMAMAVSVLCTGALAAETTYSITVKPAVSGHTYEAYQVFTGTVATGEGKNKVLSDIQWSSDLKTTDNAPTLLNAVKAITVGESNKPFESCANAADVAAVLSQDTAKDNATIKAFAKVVAKYLDSTKAKAGNFDTDADSNTYTISGLSAGYYLVKDKDNTVNTEYHDAYTNYIMEVVQNVEVTPKTFVPTVEKKIVENNTDKTETTVGVNDTVTFKLTGTLPSNYDDYDSYKYVFHDTLSKGLTFGNIESVKLYIDDTDTTGTEIPAGNGDTNYKLDQPGTETDNKCSFEVSFKDLKKLTNTTKASKIVVTYTATLNSGAVVSGNDNNVHLEYSNNPNGEGTGNTTDKKVTVYTLQLDVVKVDGADKTPLTGAKFILSTDSDLQKELTDANITANGDLTENHTLGDKMIAVKANTTSPNYIVDDSNAGTKAYVMEVCGTADNDNKGKLNIQGLKPNQTYYLYETKAPNGYNKLTAPVTITINKDGNVTGCTTANHEIQTLYVENKTGSTLPSTGGMGTKLFYTIGGILMAGAAIVLVVRKRRSDAE